MFYTKTKVLLKPGLESSVIPPYETERDRQRQTETDRDRQRQTETETDRDKKKDRPKDRKREIGNHICIKILRSKDIEKRDN